jgi:Fe-S-cluster-containing dehydrogenase component
MNKSSYQFSSSLDRRAFLKASTLAALGIASGRGIFAALDQLSPDALQSPGAPLKAGRWAMAIDMPKCLETKNCGDACVRACHGEHNVPQMGNPKDEVKWIWKEPTENLLANQDHEYQQGKLHNQPTLALCNHCDRPPCVRVCPTRATFKRADGIVVMDEHRCIGCRFCIAACPYGSRSFNWKDPRPYIAKINPDYPTRTKGVVEKCTFCSERIDRGSLPACVEACPSKAIIFGDLKGEKSAIRKIMGERYSIRRKPELGTEPKVYYLI